MELDEVVGRILRRHAWLIAVAVLTGLGTVWFLHHDDRPRYEAVVRMVLDSPDPTNQAQAAALADTARAIASGPALVRQALRDVGGARDADEFGEKSVDVRPLGSSGVLQLTVTDTDPRLAVEMANAIAESVIKSRTRVTDGTAAGAVESLNRDIASLEEQLADIDKRIDELPPGDAGARGDAATLRALERSRDSATRRLGQLQDELGTIQGQRALRPLAAVLDRATAAQHAPGRQVPDYLLGAVLGLLVGTGLAAASETLRPTLVGRTALARAVGAPVLADLPGPPDRWGSADVAAAAVHIELAAAAAGVDRVGVMNLARTVDMSGFVEFLGEALSAPIVRPAEALVASQRRPAVRADTTRPEPAGWKDRAAAVWDGDVASCGLVLVAPRVLRLRDLEPVRNLGTITGWPLLGVVVFRPARRPVLSGWQRDRMSSRPHEWVWTARNRGRTDAQEKARESTAVNRW